MESAKMAWQYIGEKKVSANGRSINSINGESGNQAAASISRNDVKNLGRAVASRR
jgi:hypothetical protein